MAAFWKTQRWIKLAALLGLMLATGVLVTLFVARSAPERRNQALATMGKPPQPAPDKRHYRSLVNYQRLEERIALLMQQPDMVGMAIATVEDGQVRFIKGYGETLADSGVPVTPDTVFRWASLSKSVASALVVGLAQDRKLSLDAPLRTMRTTLTLPGDARQVTVADVLSHRLGLVRNAWDERLEAGADPKALRAALGTLPSFCPPATCYAYQNIAYDTASEIVERAAGKSYASAAQARLFAPLGMTSSTIGQNGLQGAASWAQPHHRNRTPTMVRDDYYRIPAASGVNSSIRDLARWMKAQMGDSPTILSAAALETMHRPRVSTPPHGPRGRMDRALTGAAYGLGWRSYSYAGHALVGHRGSVDGYGSLILFDPAAQSGIVMLWNSNFPHAARLQLEFFDQLYGLPETDWLEFPAPPPPEAAIGAPSAAR